LDVKLDWLTYGRSFRERYINHKLVIFTIPLKTISSRSFVPVDVTLDADALFVRPVHAAALAAYVEANPSSFADSSTEFVAAFDSYPHTASPFTEAFQVELMPI
jgi:hypothetical protein